MRTGGLASMVSPNTKNWDLVCEFYRLMFSDDQAIRDSVSVHRNVMIIPGFSENYGDLVDPSVNTVTAGIFASGFLVGIHVRPDVPDGQEQGHRGHEYPAVQDRHGVRMNWGVTSAAV